jgi:hypothetical protein
MSLLLLSFVSIPSIARAQVTYTYTGIAFNPTTHECNGTYLPCTQLHVFGSITVPTVFAPNLNGYIFTPTAFTFLDGSGVLSLGSGSALTSSIFQVWTNASGQIIYWGIGLKVAGPTSCIEEQLGTYSKPTGESGDYSGYCFNQNMPNQAFGSGGNSGTPGSWSPPPSAYLQNALFWVSYLQHTGRLNSGQANSLSVQINNANNMISQGKYNGAIGILTDFIKQLNQWAIGGVLTWQEVYGMTNDAGMVISELRGS